MKFLTKAVSRLRGMSKAERILRRMPLEAINHNVHIMPRLGLIYVAIPKVGCSTLKATFMRVHAGDPEARVKSVHDVENQPWQHVSDFGLSETIKLIDSGEFKVAGFVRDPFARALSCYLNQFASLELDAKRPHRRERRKQLFGDAAKDASFADFVEAVGRQSTYRMNGHWRPQYEQLLMGEFGYDFIGRLEDFDRDFDRLGTLLGHDMRPYLAVSKHATGASSKLKNFYTSAIAADVRRIYSADFEAFGYAADTL